MFPEALTRITELSKSCSVCLTDISYLCSCRLVMTIGQTRTCPCGNLCNLCICSTCTACVGTHLKTRYSHHSMARMTACGIQVGVSLNKGVAFHKVLNGPNQTLIVIGGITNQDSSSVSKSPPGISGWAVSTSTPVLYFLVN